MTAVSHHQARDTAHDLSTTSDRQAASFGALLRNARERRGLTLDQVSHETKVPHRYLEALEHGDLDAVPGGTYRRGEVVAFADAVGLDREVALTELQRALDASTPVPTAARPDTDADDRPVSALAVILTFALGMLGLLLWMQDSTRPARSRDAAPPSVSIPQAPPTRITPASDNRLRTAPATTTGSTGADPSVPRSAPPDTRPSEPAARAAAPEAPLVATAAADSTPGAPASLTGEDEATAAPAPTPASSPGVLIVRTDPPGARVTVDGVGWGTTPAQIRHLEPGVKRVRVTIEGAPAEVRHVEVSDGKTTTVRIPLRQRGGRPPS